MSKSCMGIRYNKAVALSRLIKVMVVIVMYYIAM